jgi:hypothetical protein
MCPCCGNRDLTTGGCTTCNMVRIFCASCNASFCGAHHADALEKHHEFCPGIQRIGEIITYPSPWNIETSVL